MTTNIQNTGTQICFRDSTDFNPTSTNDLRIGTPTYVQIDTTSLAFDNSRQSDKVDLGTTRPVQYRVDATTEHISGISAGDVVEFYWGSSPSSTAANANPGGLTGSDGSYTSTVETLAQLHYIGVSHLRAVASPSCNISFVGFFTPTQRYGMLIVRNKSSAFHSDAVETHITLTPVVYGDA